MPVPEMISLRGLTVAQPGAPVLRAVVNQHVRVLVRDFFTLAPRRCDEAQLRLHARVLEIVRGLLDRNPRALIRGLRHPTVTGVLAAARRHAAPQGDAAAHQRFVQELDVQLLTELALQGDLPGEVTAEPGRVAWPLLRSLGARQAGAVGARERLAFAPGSVSWTPLPETYRPIAHGVVLAASDNNPLLQVQAHPDRPGNAVDFGGHPPEEWLTSLRAAFELIERYAPAIIEEMRLLLEVIVPVGYHAERHDSVSYEDSVGAIYMTLHPNLMTMTEALIHEFQHNKLNAVFRWEPVLHNAHAPLYSSPVRPDPRPLHGVLMAVHAFQPVAKMYEAMTAAGDPLAHGRDWQRRFRQIVEINREGAETVLAHGKPTELGQGLLDEIREIDASFAA